ncbi:MAG TPA: RES domain-containing protein [bacterium]|jgi:hypothetical protein
MADKGARSKCAVCGNKGMTLTVSEIAKRADANYRIHYRPGEEEPYLDIDAEHTRWVQQGEAPDEIMSEEMGSDIDIAEAVVKALSDREWHDIAQGGLAYYATDTCYELDQNSQHPHHSLWRRFCDLIKYDRRFFDDAAEDALKQIFVGLEQLGCVVPKGHYLPFLELEAGTPIYRAREARSDRQAFEFLDAPAKELGPPPRAMRRAGRLNAAGIPVFYGAFNAETCVAEIRPHVGCYVVVGKFTATRILRVIDLTAASVEPIPPNIFDPCFAELNDCYLRLKFLNVFHSLVTQPIHPDEEPIEYVPTQVVAEFLSNKMNLDGVIYTSAQVEGEDHCNIALFAADGIVEGVKSESAGETTSVLVNWMTSCPPIPFPTIRERKPSLRNDGAFTKMIQIKSVRYGRNGRLE